MKVRSQVGGGIREAWRCLENDMAAAAADGGRRRGTVLRQHLGKRRKADVPLAPIFYFVQL